MAVRICECSRRSLAQTEFGCCVSTTCINDSIGWYDCPLMRPRVGTACEWGHWTPGAITPETSCGAIITPRYCGYPDAGGTGATMVSCIDSVWRTVRDTCPVETDDEVSRFDAGPDLLDQFVDASAD